MKRPPMQMLRLRPMLGALWYGTSGLHARTSAHGRFIYDQLCCRYHGRSGESDGPACDAVKPRPRDLTARACMSSLSDKELLNLIKHVGAGIGKSPAMMAFADVFNDDDVRHLVPYLRRPFCQ
jgi:cytochrome c553